MEELKIGFDKGTFRKVNPEYNRLNGNLMYLKKKTPLRGIPKLQKKIVVKDLLKGI